MAQQTLHELHSKMPLGSPNHYLYIDNHVVKLSDIFDEIITIGTTMIPLPYAQVSRFVRSNAAPQTYSVSSRDHHRAF